MRRLSAILLLCASATLAQLDRGTFTGTLTDASGAAVPNVTVTVTHAPTGAVYSLSTNDSGQYTRPNLPIGPYQNGGGRGFQAVQVVPQLRSSGSEGSGPIT